MNLFNEINKTEGTTIVIVTHDADIGASMSRCVHIFDGKIKEDTYNKDSKYGNHKENKKVIEEVDVEVIEIITNDKEGK